MGKNRNSFTIQEIAKNMNISVFSKCGICNLMLLLLGLVLLTSVGIVKSECISPPSFGSFNGKPADNINDCFWDFVACKRQNSMGSTTLFRKGRMIGHRNKNARDQSCCQNRYHQCCEHVTGWPPLNNPPQTSTTAKPTTVPPITPRSVCPKSPPSNLIGCIWQFNCCVQEKSDLGVSENVCYKTFNRCKMVVMGMMPMDDDDNDEGKTDGDEEYTDELPSLIKPSIDPRPDPTSSSTDTLTTTSNTERPNRQRSPLTHCIKKNSKCIKNQRRRMSMPGCSRLYNQCVAKATSSSRNRNTYKP